MAEKTIATPVNQFPTLTWNHLNINRAAIDAKVSSLATPAATVAEGVSLRKASVTEFAYVECGMGSTFDRELDEFLASESKECTDVYTVKANVKSSNTKFVFDVKDGSASVNDTVIYAEEGSESTFIFVYKSEKDVTAVFGSRIRIVAEANAVVHICTVNLLGNNVTYFNDIGSKVSDSALVEQTQVEVGAKNSYSGSFNVLEGYKSRFLGHYGYKVDGERSLDINQVVRQYGRESESCFTVDGVVDHKAKKTWRGTIDFKRGCVDAKGDEQENVLLLAPCVVNKSLPVILCDEEAVEGRHGCTIGRIDAENLFYMQSRGVDQATAEHLLIVAKITSVCRFIPDAELVQEILDYVEGAFEND